MRGQGSSGEGQIGAVGAGIKVNSEGIWWTGKEKQLRGLWVSLGSALHILKHCVRAG